MQTYTDLKPTFTDPEDWTLNHVLRTYAASQPDSEFLVTPEENRRFTYAEMLSSAERIASTWYRTGAQQGERVVRTRPSSCAPGSPRPSARSSRCRSTPTTRASSSVTRW